MWSSLVFLSFFLLSSPSSAQGATSRVRTAVDVLQSWYNTTSGIWNTCGWWNGANCMTVLANLALVDDSMRDTATGVFTNTYTAGPSSNPYPGMFETQGNASAWVDGSYDDDGWWALAWIAAYDVTRNQEFLELAIGIFNHLSTDGPTNCNNGGVWSDHSHVYVNAITNELYFSVAAHLASRLDDKKYLDAAQKQWEWFHGSGMINDQGTINDGLTNDCKNNGQTTWSYNQGVVLGGLVELNKAAPKQEYLQTAAKIAKAAIAALTDTNKVVNESCDPNNCDGNSTQFKGIFIRNLQLLHSVAPDDAYVQVIRACADSIWKSDRNSNNQLGVDWSGPITTVDASTHSSAMDALVAALSVQG